MQLGKKSVYWAVVIIGLAAVIIGLSLYAGRTNVDRVVSRQLDTVIQLELNEGNKKPSGNSVLVALYLDSEDSKDTTTIAEYRCYDYPRGGYSGIQRIPFGTPWTRWEKIRSNRFKKEIVIAVAERPAQPPKFEAPSTASSRT